MRFDAGTRFGPYILESLLGAGGMGEVYRARDTRLDRIVAVKVLAPALASEPHFRARFQNEARSISALDHPHICALYDVGDQDGTAFLVMQYLEGRDARIAIGQGPADAPGRLAMRS
jgi:eukaryotic-like serine/threonine-protein kinase